MVQRQVPFNDVHWNCGGHMFDLLGSNSVNSVSFLVASQYDLVQRPVSYNDVHWNCGGNMFNLICTYVLCPHWMPSSLLL